VHKHFRLNKCRSVKIVNRSLEKYHSREKYDIAAINIGTKTLLENRKKIKNLVKKDGYLIISGVERSNHREFFNYYKTKGLHLKRVIRGKNWMGYIYRRS